MRIIIDGRMLGWTGIGRYTQALLDGIERANDGNRYIVMLQSKDWDTFTPKTSHIERVRVDIEPYSLGEQVKLPGVIRKLKPDLVHFLSFNSPVLPVGPRVTTVHDLTLLDYKNYRSGGLKRLLYEVKYYAMRFIFAIITRASSHIITDTEYIRSQLIKRGYAKPMTTSAIHLGGPLEAIPAQTPTKPLVQNPYLLYVGNMYPHKNLGTLIAAFAKIRTNPEHKDLQLVLVGKEDVYGERLLHQADQLGVRSAVHLTGFVSEDDLNNYYDHATLYVFPSLSEGFGLPPLEAMAHGTAVAASNASCMPEVLGDAAVYFDPNSIDSIESMVVATLNDKQKLSELKQSGAKRVAQFSWSTMATETYKIYEQAVSSQRR